MKFEDFLPVIKEILKFFDFVSITIDSEKWGTNEILFSCNQNVNRKFNFFNNYLAKETVVKVNCEKIK